MLTRTDASPDELPFWTEINPLTHRIVKLKMSRGDGKSRKRAGKAAREKPQEGHPITWPIETGGRVFHGLESGYARCGLVDFAVPLTA